MILNLIRRRALLACLFLLFCARWTQPSLAQSADGGKPRVAAVLFLSYQGQSRPSFDAASMHMHAWDQLNSALREQGYDPLPRDQVEPILRRRRVRDSFFISPGFLAETSDTLLAGEVLAANLIVCFDRLLLTGRAISARSGDLLWVEVIEEGVPKETGASDTTTARWVDAIHDACARLAREYGTRPPNAATTPLFMLPLRREGIDAPTATLVTHCLLRSLMSMHWRLQDPGVTVSILLDAGVDPANPGRRMRPELTGGREPSALMIGGITAYEARAAFAPAAFAFEETGAASEISMPPAALSLRLVDGPSGTVRFSGIEYLRAPESRGIFGVNRTPSLVPRIQPAADRLVQAAAGKG